MPVQTKHVVPDGEVRHGTGVRTVFFGKRVEGGDWRVAVSEGRAHAANCLDCLRKFHADVTARIELAEFRLSTVGDRIAELERSGK